jgi:hypothetical protein
VCSNHRQVCKCGSSQANIMFKNHILPPSVIRNLYCPRCSTEARFYADKMIADNNWVLEFDMDLATNQLQRAHVHTTRLSPTFLFDEGYVTWNGLSPTELEQRLAERQEIIALATQDMRLYLDRMKHWGCRRAQALRAAGLA